MDSILPAQYAAAPGHLEREEPEDAEPLLDPNTQTTNSHNATYRFSDFDLAEYGAAMVFSTHSFMLLKCHWCMGSVHRLTKGSLVPVSDQVTAQIGSATVR